MNNLPNSPNLRPVVIGAKSEVVDLNADSDSPISQGRIPEALEVELARMRRNPAEFWVRRRVSCALGCPKVDGVGAAYALSHANSDEAGSWCLMHGWTSFDSVSCPPTERLKPHEIEERELAAKRKRGPRKKTAGKQL
jgi:hypothetical protein